MNAPAIIGTSGTGPAQENERVETIDVLRGFALLGILLVNIGFFAYPISEPFYLAPSASATDKTVHWLTALLAQGKFYPLFSLLFGLGFALQLDRARARGNAVEQLYVRRLVILLFIGLLHGIFIWAGDILTAYAVLGFFLLLFARVTPRVLLVAAVAAYGAQLLLIGAFMLAVASVYADPKAAEDLLLELTADMNEAAALRAQAWAAYADGSYLEVTVVRLREYSMALQNMVFFGLQVMAMFLLGAWFGARGILAHPQRHRRLLKSLLTVAVVIGLPISFIFAELNSRIDYPGKPSATMGHAYLLNIVAGALLALGYLAAITLAMQTRTRNVLRYLVPVGRMALSNYLLQSVICTLIFYPYGLGLFAQLSAAELVIVVLAVFVLQLVLSSWWIARFRFGPAEWLWRSLTYLELQPMRRDVAEPWLRSAMRERHD